MRLVAILLMAMIVAQSKVFAEDFVNSHSHDIDTQQIKQLVNYYYSDAQLPLLADVKICSGIYKSGVNQFNCLDEYQPNAIPLDQPLYVWMQYFVPKNSSEKLLLQLNHQGITRDALSFSVNGSIRYRVWQRVKFSKLGEWDLPILVDSDNSPSPLATIKLTVVPAQLDGSLSDVSSLQEGEVR